MSQPFESTFQVSMMAKRKVKKEKYNFEYNQSKLRQYPLPYTCTSLMICTYSDYSISIEIPDTTNGTEA